MPIKDWFKKSKLHNNSIYSLGEEIARNYLTKNLTNFSSHVDEQTLELIWNQMKEMIISISSQDNNLMQTSMLRKHISETTNIRAEYEILLLNQNNDLNNWTKEKGISGELHKHLHQIYMANTLLDQTSNKDNRSSNEILSLIRLGMYTASWYNEVLNGLRSPLKDFQGTKDWYNSFLCSCLIVQEDKYRKSINLDTLIERQELIDAYNTFKKFVIDCHSDPFHAWEIKHSKLLKDGDISLPS